MFGLELSAAAVIAACQDYGAKTPQTPGEKLDEALRKQQRNNEELRREMRAMESRLRIHNICSRSY